MADRLTFRSALRDDEVPDVSDALEEIINGAGETGETDAAGEKKAAEEEEAAGAAGEASGEMPAEGTVLTPAPSDTATGPFTPSLGLTIGLAALAAALAVCAVGLFIANLRLRKRQKAAPAAPAAAAGPVTGVQVGKLHAQGAREYQQDSFGVSDVSLLSGQGLLAVVADGMGGLSDGDKVSSAAVSAALDTFVLMQGRGTPEQILLTVMQQAQSAVNGLLGPENYRKSGTTFLLGLLKDSAFSFLSVGDSHIYLLRDGALTLLNREHIFKNELAVQGVNGELPLPDVYTDDRGGGLISYIGMGQLKYIDIPAEPVEARPGDKFILMSDGVYNAMEREELCAALAGTPDEAAERLGAVIEGKGYTNQDNYTAVILACE